eukprot:13304-Heterococcus_DN1.PRE.2
MHWQRELSSRDDTWCTLRKNGSRGQEMQALHAHTHCILKQLCPLPAATATATAAVLATVQESSSYSSYSTVT